MSTATMPPSLALTGQIEVQIDYDRGTYRLVAPNGEEGEVFELGGMAYLEASGITYAAFRDYDEAEDEIVFDPDMGEGVMMLIPVACFDAEVELVEEGEDEDEDEDDNDDDNLVCGTEGKVPAGEDEDPADEDVPPEDEG